VVYTSRRTGADDSTGERRTHLAAGTQDEDVAVKTPTACDVRFARCGQTILEIVFGR
jgi:hypothetical protein